MTILNAEEKVTILIKILDRHIEELKNEDCLSNYLDSIRYFLKSKDPINQKAAISNSELFITNISNAYINQINSKRVVASLVAAFDKVGYNDSMDAAAVILQFEDYLKNISMKEAENLYNDRWLDK